MNVPVPNGYINIANGNLHMELSLSTLKQRGQLALNERLVYDSRIWKIIQYNNYYWWPLNIPNASAGWRFVKGNEIGSMAYSPVSSSSNDCGYGNGETSGSYLSSMTWTDPGGTAHLFDAIYSQYDNCDGSTTHSVSSGYATDATGYQVFDDGNGNPIVKDSSGSQVYPNVIDRFGNYFSPDNGSDLVDDLGRIPVITTQNGNQTYYDVLAPNGPISNNGTRVRYTVTYEQLTLNTSFNQSGVVEYQNNGNPPGSNHPNITAIQSIQLPDGSSYQFSYDSYGTITSVTLPTGGVVGYAWTNFQDSYQNVNHWATTSTVAGNNTTYTPAVVSNCSSGGTGCQEKVTVQPPSGDQTIYTLTLDNGAWDTSTSIYSGNSYYNQVKAADQTTYDFTKVCNNTIVCGGAQYVTKSNEVKSLPDAAISTQIQTTYQNPQSGQVSSVSQWDFYPSSSSPSATPSRQTQYGYTGYDITSEKHFDQNGTLASSVAYNYTTSATATSGIVAHGAANAGGPYLTSVVTTNNSPVATATSTMTYEDTGALLTAQDANGNPATVFKYDPTHTFVIETDRPDTTTFGTTFHHVTTATYDPNSGALLSTNDENSVANGKIYSILYNYESVAGRLHQITYPNPAGGSQTYTYPNYNEVDVAVAQTASVNTTTAQIVDGYGRPSQTTVGGTISSTQTYDGNGRPYSVTTPAVSSSSSTDGTTYTYYDALNRVSSVTNPDGTSKSIVVVGNVATATDELGSQVKQTFNAFGDLMSVIEADPQTGALDLETDYVRDGLGNITCVEQHGNVSGTGCSAPPSSDATSPWRVRRFFYNSLSQLRAASIPEHTSTSSPAAQNCGSGTSSGPWTDCYSYDSNGNLTQQVDNRGVARNYTYDALNRPLIKTSPNGATQDLSYDAGQNAVGLLWHESNDVNAASSYGYDVLGRLTSESSCRPSNCATAYVNTSASYDLAGNLKSITYPDGRTITNGYDSLNRPSTVTYQQWGASTVGTTYWTANSYAPPGELQGAQFGNGMQMQAAYTSRESLLTLAYSSTPPAAAQTYFSKGYSWAGNATNLVMQYDYVASKQRQFGYDKLNRLISATDVTSTATNATGTATIRGTEGYYRSCPGGGGGDAVQTSGANDAQTNGGGSCTNIYDTGNLTITVGGFSATVAYGQGSTPASLAAGLAAQLNNSYLTATVSGATITLTATSSSANYALSYTSDGDFSVNFSGPTLVGGTTYTPVYGGFSQQYTLDAWGNLSQMGGTNGFSQSINGKNQVAGFSYDAAGRVLTGSEGNFAYDDDGMLVSSSDGTSYVYDALQQRAQIANGGSTKEYYYFAGTLLATYIPATGAWSDMVYAGGQKIAVVGGTQAATPIYLTPDQVGSEAGSVDNNGNQLAASDFSPFGQKLSGTPTDSFLFTGLERDQTGLDHAGFRQYSSTTGRWTVPDPYDGSYVPGDPQSLSRYAYARNSPLAFTDTSGLQYNTHGDGAPVGGGGDCGLACIGFTLLIDAIEDAFGFLGSGPSFTGNISAQHTGLIPRVNPDGSVNVSALGPDGEAPGMGQAASRDFTGVLNGTYYSHGEPGHRPVNLRRRIALVRGLFSANCSTVLAKDIPGFKTNGLFNTLRSAYNSGRILQYPSSAPLDIDPTANAVTIQESKTILLLPHFYDQGVTQIRQAFTLAHEALHLYTGANDPSIQNALHLTISYNTGNITDFLQGGCR